MSNGKATPGKYLTFQIKGEMYGVPIETVREINSMIEVTPVPQVPSYVKGVINLRGKVISVINLRLRLGMEAGEYTRDTCIVVIDAAGGQLGVIVDTVKEVQDLEENQIEKSPKIGDAENDNKFLIGMGKLKETVIMLIDLTDALSAEEMDHLSKQNAVESEATMSSPTENASEAEEKVA